MAASILAPTESRRSQGTSTHLREHRADAPADLPTRSRVVVEGLTALFGATVAVKDVSMTLLDRRVTAIIGPSGCGKSTFLRCLNRMHETVGTASVRGKVLLDGHDIYGPGINALRSQGANHALETHVHLMLHKGFGHWKVMQLYHRGQNFLSQQFFVALVAGGFEALAKLTF